MYDWSNLSWEDLECEAGDVIEHHVDETDIDELDYLGEDHEPL